MMKRAFIGGFLSLIGSIWALAILLLASNNLVSGWSTPPGRLLTTISELQMMPWFLISVAFILLGIVIMAIEYFRKDNG